jgi:RimJ/RimL family protein N-acetyltransferase
VTSDAIACGRRALLRDPRPSDAESWVRWRQQGEWREYDAPWEALTPPLTSEKAEQARNSFVERCSQEHPSPRRTAIIATPDGEPVGSVIRYSEQRFPDAWYVGIDICEDALLNQGIGTAALALWIDHLFSLSDVHRIGLRTYSFNPRMMKVAEKVGFVPEAVERELIRWRGEWLDRVGYGMLRTEWERARVSP